MLTETELKAIKARHEAFRPETMTVCADVHANIIHRDRAALLAEVERLRHGDYRRWNVEEWEHGVRVCRGDHDRSTACEWELFWKAPDPRLTRLVEGLEEIRQEANECGSFMWIEEHADQLIKEARTEKTPD